MPPTSKKTGSATLKGLIMLAAALGGPWYLLTQTSAGELLDRYLTERRLAGTRHYDWGGGDAARWEGARGGGGNAESWLPGLPPGRPVEQGQVATVSFEQPAPWNAPSGSADPLVPPTQAAGDDPFSAIEGRLRELGAVYYVLETRDLDKPRYRFLCRTSLAGNQVVTQKFEATESSPLAAMRNVLHQVERWRSGW